MKTPQRQHNIRERNTGRMAETKGLRIQGSRRDIQLNLGITESRMQCAFLAVNGVSFRLNESSSNDLSPKLTASNHMGIELFDPVLKVR